MTRLVTPWSVPAGRRPSVLCDSLISLAVKQRDDWRSSKPQWKAAAKSHERLPERVQVVEPCHTSRHCSRHPQQCSQKAQERRSGGRRNHFHGGDVPCHCRAAVASTVALLPPVKPVGCPKNTVNKAKQKRQDNEKAAATWAATEFQKRKLKPRHRPAMHQTAP